MYGDTVCLGIQLPKLLTFSQVLATIIKTTLKIHLLSGYSCYFGGQKIPGITCLFLFETIKFSQDEFILLTIMHKGLILNLHQNLLLLLYLF